MPKKPQDEDFYARLARDYAKPRTYAGYSAGQPEPAIEGNVAPQGGPGGLPPMRMDEQTFGALMQGRPAPPQAPYAPAPQSMDANAFSALMQGGQANRPIPGSAPIMPQGFTGGIPESSFIDGRQYDQPQGPPMPLGMAIGAGANRNALRQSLYPYMQRFGLAR
jgi:hypothetical protein